MRPPMGAPGPTPPASWSVVPTHGPYAGSERRRRLGEVLIDAGLLTDAQLARALEEQKRWGGKLGHVLVDMGLLDEDAMVRAISEQLKLSVVDLASFPLPPGVHQHLRVDLAELFGAFPLGGDEDFRTVRVAMAEPSREALEELAKRTGKRVQAFVATASSIERAIREHYYGERPHASRAPAPPEEVDLEELTALPGVPAAGVLPEVTARLDAMAAQVQSLEQLVASQLKAMRGLLELLVEQGVLRHEDYLAKVRRERKAP
jgi:type IV pilus assembly protein PilB